MVHASRHSRWCRKVSIYKTIESKVRGPVAYGTRQCDMLSVHESTSFTWRLSVTTASEKRRFIVVGFQNREKNRASNLPYKNSTHTFFCYTSKCSDVCGNVQTSVEMFRRLSKYSDVCRNVQTSVEMFRRLSKCSDVCRNVQTSVEMFRRLPKCSDVCRNVQTSVEMFRRVSKRPDRPNLPVQPSNPGTLHWVQRRPENVRLRAPGTASELRVDSLSKLRRLVEESSCLTKTTSVVDRHSTLLSVYCLDCLVVVTFFSAQSSVVCLTFSNRIKRALSNQVRESCRTRSRKPCRNRSREPFNAVPIGRGRHLNNIY